MQIRKATIEDIPALFSLNQEFNGSGSTTIEAMLNSIKNNTNEIVIIGFYDNVAAGFVCGQICQSICYSSLHGEVAELFVSDTFRRKALRNSL